MKKILYIIGVLFALASCTKQEVDEPTTNGANPDGTFTFNLAVEEPDYAPQAKAAVTMGRYILEMYEGNLSATPLKMDNTTGTFDVSLKKGVDYVCLFWADNGTDYDAASLKAVKQATETNLGTAAYFANVQVNSKTFNGAITLKRAVAELSFVGQSVLAEATNKLKITYPYASATLNVGDGTVTHAQGSTVRLIENIAPPAQLTDAFASDFVLAPTAAGSLVGLKLLLNTEVEKTIPQTAIQANYRTKITGDYQEADPIPFMSLTIDTRKNTNNTSDATFILPLQATLSGYSLTVDWGDGNTDEFADGTVLAQANMTHTYAAAGVYPITISSSQEDVTNVQMPKINFGGNYTSVNENPAKLISLDTPLLNMGTSLSSCFSDCTGLTTLPATLFEKNTVATDFSYCFFDCTGLTSIPAGLFEKNTAATTFTNCFGRCTGLTTLPATLFEKNTVATNFYGCFSGCTGLTTLPATLFEKNPLVTNFDNCFGSCTGLTTLPPTLFEKNTVATDFSGCFFGCTGLTTLPATLFEKNTVATKFNNCFNGCTGLTTLPATLFEKNPEVTTFDSCFSGCTGLTSIPAMLFEKNTAATTFSRCFIDCTKAVLNPDIFCTEASDKATRFAGKTMNFSGCFENCGSDSSVAAGAGGVAPELWTYTMDISSTKAGCFTNVTKVTNAASIPTAWK